MIFENLPVEQSYKVGFIDAKVLNEAGVNQDNAIAFFGYGTCRGVASVGTSWLPMFIPEYDTDKTIIKAILVCFLK